MADISEQAILHEQMRNLQRYSNLSLYRDRAMETPAYRSKAEYEQPGLNLYASAYRNVLDRDRQMNDLRRKATMSEMSSNRLQTSEHKTNDLMKSNYRGHYNFKIK